MSEKAETTTRLQASYRRSLGLYGLPSWGFLEEIEIRPVFDLFAPNGEKVPVDVQIIARDVK